MKESKEESLVCMQRRTETSLSHSASKYPMKRRHRSLEESPVAWYNLEKTKPQKKYRRAEFDYYTEPFKDSHPMQELKQGEHENAVNGDFEFVIEEQDKGLQSSDELQERTTRGAKRTKLQYLPEDANSVENSVLHSESLDTPPWPSTADESSSKSTHFASSAPDSSSKSTQYASSAPDLEDPDSDEVSHPSGVSKRNVSKLKEKHKTHDQQSFNVYLKYQNRSATDKKTGEYLAFDALVDVHLAVKASYRTEKVPFVCLTSKLNGNTIFGYPLEIEELSDSSKFLLPRKGGAHYELFDDERNRFDRLSWRTSRRTPVCYITKSLSTSSSKNAMAGQASENVERSLSKFLKNNKMQFKQEKTALSRSCVPVELIFSKILAAVGQVQS